MVDVCVEYKSVPELTPTEYRACSLANYGLDEGFMLWAIRDARSKKDHTAKVIMLWDANSTVGSTKGLIGWALLTPVTTQGLLAATTYTKRKSKYTAQFWVKRQYRRQGFGKMLMAEVKKYDDRPHVFPHDKASGAMFSSYNVTVLKWDLPNIERGKPKVA